jgi:hypothetical protein
MDIFATMGGLAEIARREGCKASSVSEWKKRGIPLERCPRLERAYQGRVTCEQMRPDISWTRVTDPAWQWHPNGRPLVDFAAAATSTGADTSTDPQPEIRNAA